MCFVANAATTHDWPEIKKYNEKGDCIAKELATIGYFYIFYCLKWTLTTYERGPF